jgi:alpha-beta hydrolase superfamily lysophospholipase
MASQAQHSEHAIVASEPLTTYLELRESTAEGGEGAGLSHKSGGLVLLHVLEIAAHGEPRGGVTLVHDAGDHGGRYVDAAHALAHERWAVALPDLRGHGRSEGARGHSAGAREVVRDLDAVQQHLAYRLPIAPKVLIGTGLGALYALAYALEQPGQTAALVLLAPRWSPSFELPKPSGLFARFKKLDANEPGKVGNDPEKLFSDAAARAAWRSDPLVHDVITLRAAEQARELAALGVQRVASVGVPVLVLHGSADTIADPSLSSKLAGPGVEVRTLDGQRHDLLHEPRATQTIASIRDWLDRSVR